MDSLTFLPPHEQIFAEQSLILLEQKKPDLYVSLGRTKLTYILSSLNAALPGIFSDHKTNVSKLLNWALNQHQAYHLSLGDIYAVLSAARSVLTAGVARSSNEETLHSFSAILDDAMLNIIQVFDAQSQELLNTRIQEIETIARELDIATEESDRALVQLQLLYEAMHQFSASLDVYEIMEKTSAHLTAATYARSSVIWILDESAVNVVAVSGFNKEKTTQPLKLSLTESSCIRQAIQEKKPVVVEAHTGAASEFDQELLTHLGAKLLLALPLIVQDNVIGAATIYGSNKKVLTELDLAQAIVQQAAMAIQNGRLYDKVRQLNQSLEHRIEARTYELVQEKNRLETMYRISTALTKTLDLNKLLNETLQQLTTAVNAHQGVIMLNKDAWGGDFCYQASSDGHIGPYLPNKVDDLLSTWVISHREGLLVGDLLNDDRWSAFADGNCSVVAAPIMADIDLHGVLLLMDPQVNQFSLEQLRLVEAVSMQLATAINNARLHDFVMEQVVRLEDVLRTQEVEFGQKQAILSSIADGVIACELNGKVLLMNPASEEIIGKRAEDLIGQPVQEIFAIFESPGRQEIQEALARTQKGGYGKSNDAQTIPDIFLERGNRIINARTTAAVTSANEMLGTVTVLRDITKEVEANRAKAEFITTVSHELRTPMTSIRGYTELLMGDAAGTLHAQQKHMLGIIKRNAERLSLLINDLLDISRIEAGKVNLHVKEIALETLANHVVEMMLIPAENKDLSLTLEVPAQTLVVKADWDRLTQVLTNLVANAIAYTEMGGVTVSLKELPDAVEVSVQDTGIGITPDDLQHIFERFYRADHDVVQANRGTGLGLAIVKSYIEMHGGRIWVSSKYGEGSTFTFILPRGQGI